MEVCNFAYRSRFYHLYSPMKTKALPGFRDFYPSDLALAVPHLQYLANGGHPLWV